MSVNSGETAVIGDQCLLYQGVTLGGTGKAHGKRHPTLAENVVVGAGAKVLGPITVGKGGKVGSNAVVVRDVPPGATAVGIPARIIEGGQEQAREAKANQMGFSAYGVGRNDGDPLSEAINQAIRGLLDHALEMDQRIADLQAQLARSGVSEEDQAATADKFDPRQVTKIAGKK